MIEKVRAEGQPVLVLDGGDALSATAGPYGEREVERARLILAGMGQLGTAGMAVGDRDLAMGVRLLKEAAAQAKVPLLSANLLGAGGEPLFTRSLLLPAGKVQVGVLAVYAPTPGTPLPPGVTAADPVRAARDVAFELREKGAALVIALVHGPSSIVDPIAAIAGIDLLIPAHDGIARPPHRPAGQAWVMGAGQKGRDLTRVSLFLDGQGPLGDGGAPARAAEEVAYLEQRIAGARERAGRAEGAAKDALLRVVASLEQRLGEARTRATASVLGRSFRLSATSLDEHVPDQPAMAALVKRFEERFPPPPPR